MNSVIGEYFSSKSKELIKYATELSCMFTYDMNLNIEDKKALKNVISNYINNFYKVNSFSYEKINKYYNLNEETDPLYKASIECTLRYYEDNKRSIAKYNEEIIYISYLVYFALLVDKLRETILIVPNKYEFIGSIAHRVSRSFNYTLNDRYKNHAKKIVSMIRENTKKDRKLRETINTIYNKDFYNEYKLVNEEENLYEVSYVSVIKELEKYKQKDVKRIYDKYDYENSLKLTSFALAQVALLKCIFNEKIMNILLNIDSSFYKKKGTINDLLNLIANQYTKDHMYLLMSANSYEENDLIKKIKSNGIKIAIHSGEMKDIKNITFDDNMILLTDINTINNHKSELTNIKYLKYSDLNTYKEYELFNSKIKEENYE